MARRRGEPVPAESAAILTRCAQYAADRTLCLLRGDGDGFQGLASAFSLEVDEHTFLVTAGHVVDDVIDGKELIFIAPAPGSVGATVVGATCALRTTDVKRRRRRDDDPVDVAILPLDRPTADYVRSLPTRASFHDVDGKERGDGSPLLMSVGYPEESVALDAEAGTVEAGALAYYGPAVPPSVHRPKRRGDAELRIRYSRSGCMNIDGSQARARDLHGMSGSGVWRVRRRDGEVEDPPRLVAVLHTVDDVARATSMAVVLVQVARHLGLGGLQPLPLRAPE